MEETSVERKREREEEEGEAEEEAGGGGNNYPSPEGESPRRGRGARGELAGAGPLARRPLTAGPGEDGLLKKSTDSSGGSKPAVGRLSGMVGIPTGERANPL